jgi:hypothetical protein
LRDPGKTSVLDGGWKLRLRHFDGVVVDSAANIAARVPPVLARLTVNESEVDRADEHLWTPIDEQNGAGSERALVYVGHCLVPGVVWYCRHGGSHRFR